MRTGSTKGNDALKVLRFYRVNFGYEPPYRVLLDADMIQTSISNNLYIKNTLPNLLNATAYVVVTACVVRTLRDAGETHSSASLFAKRATRVPCTHEGKKSAADCIKSRMLTPFEFKLVLGSNDAALIAQLASIPGIPLISLINNTKLVLRPPTKLTLQFVRQSQSAEESTLNKSDKVLIDRVRAQQKATVNPNQIVRKHKRPKGPNPLSVKKPTKNVARAPADLPSDINLSLSGQGVASATMPSSNVQNDAPAKQETNVNQTTGNTGQPDTEHQSATAKPSRKRKRVRIRQKSRTDGDHPDLGEQRNALTKGIELGTVQNDLSPSRKRQKTSKKPPDAHEGKNLKGILPSAEAKSIPATSKGSEVNAKERERALVQSCNGISTENSAAHKETLCKETGSGLPGNSNLPNAVCHLAIEDDASKAKSSVGCSENSARSCESPPNGNPDKEHQSESEAGQNDGMNTNRKRQRKNRRRRPKKDDSSS